MSNSLKKIILSLSLVGLPLSAHCEGSFGPTSYKVDFYDIEDVSDKFKRAGEEAEIRRKEEAIDAAVRNAHQLVILRELVDAEVSVGRDGNVYVDARGKICMYILGMIFENGDYNGFLRCRAID